MENNFTQQEILINTRSGFLTKDWCLKNELENSSNKTEQEKLEEACWNGVVRQVLPELFTQQLLTLWKVRTIDTILELELANYPAETDQYLSITPHQFLTTLNYN